jgi:capsular polysaccharide transport system permease protein
MSERNKGLVSRLAPQAAANDGHELVPTENTGKEVVADGPIFRTSLQGYFVGGQPGFWRRNLRFFLFLLVVGLPSALAGVYYGLVASNQYVTDIQFGVRSADGERGGDTSSMLQGASAASQLALQSNVVVQYIRSREIVEAIDKKIDLRKVFSTPSADYFSRLDSNTPIEDLVDYWRGKVEPFFDQTTGIVSVRVRAFTPQDALGIGNEIVRRSENLADDLSQRARSDYVKFAQEQVDQARARLTQAREALLEFRNRGQTLDPVKEAEIARLGVAKLRDELARVDTDMATARARLGENSPTMLALKDRKAALEPQIAQAEAKLAGSRQQAGTMASQNIRGYDALETDRQFAEKFYETALQALQHAQFEASRKSMYLEVFVRPALAEQSLYPRRFVATLIVVLSAFGVWIFLLMAYYSVREHV